MSWRVAKCLPVLKGEIDASAPNRSQASDGFIGDAAHQGTNSDHNPWCNSTNAAQDNGVVTAGDFTHDPTHGFDSYKFADWLRRRCKGEILLNGEREIRVKYIISNRRITSPSRNWQWETYTGTDPHTNHVHVSVDCTKNGGYMDSTAPWGWYTEADMTWTDNQVTAETFRTKAIADGTNPITYDKNGVTVTEPNSLHDKLDGLIDAVAALSAPGATGSGGGGGVLVSIDDIRAVVREELDKTSLGGP